MRKKVLLVTTAILVGLCGFSFTYYNASGTTSSNPFSNLNMTYDEVIKMAKSDPLTLIKISLKMFPELKNLVVSLIILLMVLIAASFVLMIHEMFEWIRRRSMYTFDTWRKRRRNY